MDATPASAPPADNDAVAPNTGGLSAFEALGFEPRSFEPHEPASTPVDTSRFKTPAEPPMATPPADDRPAPASPAPASPAPGVPPMVAPGEGTAAGVPPTPFFTTDASRQPSFDEPPPPLAEPPRREVPRVTHAFASSDLGASALLAPGTVAPGAVTPGSSLPGADAQDAGFHPAVAFPAAESSQAGSLPRADAHPVEEVATQAYSPPLGVEPIAVPAGGGTAAGAPLPHESRGGHPVLGPLTPRPREVPNEARILDVAAMVLAFVLPPVGFVVGLVASSRGRVLRGWASGLARAAVWVSVLMTLVFVAVGTWLWFEHQERVDAQREADAAAAAHAAVVAESAEFCGALAAVPTVFAADDPDYGWPTSEDPAGYLPAITNYAAMWQGLVPIAPTGITEQVQAFSGRVDGIVTVASSLPTPNRPGDVLDLHSQPDIAAIDAYVAEYCAPAPAE